jgi:shikimate dehydrogenase
MFPANGETPIEPALFRSLEGVFDAVYNPLSTALVLKARESGVPAAGGLYMLAAQAKYAREIFSGGRDKTDTLALYKKLLRRVQSVTLTGMPSVGKSTVGRVIAKMTGKAFYDTDAEICRNTGKTVAQLFLEKGEEYFRGLERDTLAALGKKSGIVISAGGGAVLGRDAYNLAAQNGSVVWLTRDKRFADAAGRPLLQDAGAYEKLLAERTPLYRKFSDIEIENAGTPEKTAAEIVEKLGW